MSTQLVKHQPNEEALLGGDPKPQEHSMDEGTVGVQYCQKSLFVFDLENGFRQLCIKVMHSNIFNNFILLVILANAITMGMVDYKVVDLNTYEPVVENGREGVSARNKFLKSTEVPFLTIFIFEMVVKMVSMGFVQYMKDNWNRLDFIVVCVGILEFLPGMPNISFLRSFRALRPLRSLNRFPALRTMVSAFILSLGQLTDVIVFIIFIFVIFGITSVQLWGGLGAQQGRCRATAFPVQLPDYIRWNRTHRDDVYEELRKRNLTVKSLSRCLPDVLDNEDWSQESSPWAQGTDCFWPLATDPWGPVGGVMEDGPRLCSLPWFWGKYDCAEGLTCGSNYERATGLPRFNNKYVMEAATFDPDGELNFGLTLFGNIMDTFITLFTCITCEGWSSVLYEVSNSYHPVVAGLYFSLLILLGNFFSVNLVLAVIWDMFIDVDESIRSTQAKQGYDECLLLEQARAAAAQHSGTGTMVEGEGTVQFLTKAMLLRYFNNAARVLTLQLYKEVGSPIVIDEEDFATIFKKLPRDAHQASKGSAAEDDVVLEVSV
jgi:hypothetical protein